MSGARVGRPWPAWLAVVVGALAVLLAAALVAAPGSAAAWFLLSGARPADIARPMAAWAAASGVVGFAVGGWLAARVAGARGNTAIWLGAAAGVAALAMIVALVVVGLGGALAPRPAGVALGIFEPTPTLPPPVPGWVEVAPAAIGPPEVARERTIDTIAYLVAAAALSLAAAGFGGVIADRGAAHHPTGGDDG